MVFAWPVFTAFYLFVVILIENVTVALETATDQGLYDFWEVAQIFENGISEVQKTEKQTRGKAGL